VLAWCTENSLSNLPWGREPLSAFRCLCRHPKQSRKNHIRTALLADIRSESVIVLRLYPAPKCPGKCCNITGYRCSSGYNRRVLRVSAALLVATIVLISCGNSIRSKDKVQEAIINRLQTKSGLDVNSLDIATTSVSFEKNMAYATVAFHPKGDPSVNSGMVMKYTLEARDGKWVIVNVNGSQGHGTMGHTSASTQPLPPGHPPIDAGDPHASPQSQEANGRTQ